MGEAQASNQNNILRDDAQDLHGDVSDVHNTVGPVHPIPGVV